MSDKPKVPKSVTTYHKVGAKVEHILNSRAEGFSEAHAHAFKHLEDIVGDNGGELENHHLRNKKFREAYVDAFVTKMEQVAKGRLRSDPDHILGDGSDEQNQIYENHLFEIYSGMNKQGMKKALSQYLTEVKTIGDFNSGALQQAFTQSKPYKEVAGKLRQSKANHFDESTIDDILNHTGAKKFFQRDKVSSPYQIAQLLDLHYATGEVSVDDAVNLVASIDDPTLRYALVGDADKEFKSRYETPSSADKKVEKLYTPKPKDKMA
jgi:hypothetical protein